VGLILNYGVEAMAILNDKFMTWDDDAHFYLPSAELMQNKLNLNLQKTLGGETEARLFLEDTMWFIKDYIVAYGDNRDVKITTRKIEYDTANDDNHQRRDLQRAYVEFVRYAKNDEGDMVSLQTGINLIKGQIVPIDELRGRRELSGRLERILRNSGLLYGGIRTWTIPTEAVYGTDY